MKSFLQPMKFIAAILLISTSIFFVSCEKDETETPENTQNSSTPNLGDGTLVAVNTEATQTTPIGEIPINLGTAVAAFAGSSNYGTLVDGGTVSVDGNALTKYDNNSYVFTPGLTSPTGIEFGSNVKWTISGNSGSGVPAFEHTYNRGFPNIGSITSGTEVSKAGYTLTFSSISNADSVYLLINDVVKSLPGNARSYTFTSGELSGLSTGQGNVTVAGWNYGTASYGGKNFYFVNETVKIKSVNITN